MPITNNKMIEIIKKCFLITCLLFFVTSIAYGKTTKNTSFIEKPVNPAIEFVKIEIKQTSKSVQEKNELYKLYEEGLLFYDKNMLKEALDKFHKASSITSLPAFNAAKGNIYFLLNNYKTAIYNYDVAIKEYEVRNEKKILSILWRNKGLVLHNQTELDEALALYTKAYKVDTQAENKKAQAEDLRLISSIHRQTGDFEKAITLLNKALEIDRSTAYEQGQAESLGNLGIVYKDMAQYKKAMSYHQQALAIDKRLGYKMGIAEDLGNIGLIYSATGENNKAIQFVIKSYSIYKSLNYSPGRAKALGNLSLIYLAQGNYDKAQQYLDYANRILDKSKH